MSQLLTSRLTTVSTAALAYLMFIVKEIYDEATISSSDFPFKSISE